MGFRHAWTAFALCLLVACPSTEQTNAKQRWQNQQLSTYQYTLTRSCFCPSDITQAIRIEIRNQALGRMTYVADGKDVPTNFRPTLLTIEQYFNEIDRLLRAQGTLRVNYDATRGFPTTIDSDPIPNAADDEIIHTLSDFAPG